MSDLNTEDRIVEAAEEEFIERGFDGARMQAIANKAGINKALLHYYYRTKDKLFEIVFSNVIKKIFPRVTRIFDNNIPLEEKIRQFTNVYIETIISNPHIPNFVIHELNNNPSFLVKHLKYLNINFEGLRSEIRGASERGEIIEIDPNELLINIISLCIFPVVARPILENLVFEGDKVAYENHIEKRKTSVADFVINSIKIKKYDS